MKKQPIPKPPTTRELIALEVSAQMRRKRVRQQDLAEALNKPQPWVSRRLRGDVPFTVDDLIVICSLLGVTVNDILAGIDPEPVAAALDRRGQREPTIACSDTAPFVPFAVLDLAA